MIIKKFFLSAVALLLLAGAGCSLIPGAQIVEENSDEENVEKELQTKSEVKNAVPVSDAKPISKANNQQAANTDTTGIQMRDLVGGWMVVKGQTTGFESITLDGDGKYYSHLHDRPYDQGAWKIKNNSLFLISDAGADFNNTFTKLRFNNGKLEFNVGPVVSAWKKIAE